MAFVQKAVARLYEPEKLETLLQDLGKKHFAYGAKQKYVDVSSSHWNVILIPSTGNIKAFRVSINVISSSKQRFLYKFSTSVYWQVIGHDNIVKTKCGFVETFIRLYRQITGHDNIVKPTKEIIFSFSNVTTCPCGIFVVLSPGHGRSVADF